MLLMLMKYLSYIDFIQKHSTLILSEDMEELEVLIAFTPNENLLNQTRYFYYNLKLFIVYGTHSELVRRTYGVTSCSSIIESIKFVLNTNKKFQALFFSNFRDPFSRSICHF